MGVVPPDPGILDDRHRLSEDLRVDSLQFILFVLKLEKAMGRKIFDAGSIGKAKTIHDIRALMERPVPA
jgi:hypothetical protein